jgi:hypothetical protein
MPWAYGLTLQSWVWDTESMQRIIREVAIGVCLCNDIASLQKELRLNDVDSIIPVLVHHRDLSAQEAADAAVEMILQSYQDFLAATTQLRDAASALDGLGKRDVEVLIRGCTDVLVGNVMFYMRSQRYLSRHVFDDEGNGFSIVL